MIFPLRPGPLSPATGLLNGWRITSYFGGRIDPLTGRAGSHGGMDLAYWGCAGEPMLAVESGRVVQSWDNSGGGWWTTLHGDSGATYGYGHASRYADPDGGGPETNYSGHHVEAGTVIAYVGTSGGSTGAHLHFAYRPGWWSPYRDPYDLLMGAEVQGRLMATVGADPLLFATIKKDWSDMATRDELQEDLRTTRDEILARVNETIGHVEANLAALVRALDVDNDVALENVQGNLAGVVRAESDETYVALVNVQHNLATIMREEQAAGTLPTDLDVAAIAADVAGRLTVTPKT